MRKVSERLGGWITTATSYRPSPFPSEDQPSARDVVCSLAYGAASLAYGAASLAYGAASLAYGAASLAYGAVSERSVASPSSPYYIRAPKKKKEKKES